MTTKSKKPEAKKETKKQEKAAPDRHGESTVASPVKVVRDLVAAHPDWERKQVMAEAMKRGVAFYTCATQYQKAKAEQRKAKKAK